MSPHLAISHDDARPHLAIRIGIAGHREIAATASAGLEAAVRRVLADIKGQLSTLMKRSDAAMLYRPGPLIHVTSPLAKGADRIGARAALAEGAILSAVLPMPEKEYRKDFGDDDTEFDTLRSKAAEHGAVTELYLEPEHGEEQRDGAYNEAGLYVLRHSDLLVTIWNGMPSKGLGGTGDIVAEAILLGVPVIHIHADNPGTANLIIGPAEPTPYDAGAVALILEQIAFPPRHRCEHEHTGHSDERNQHRAAMAYYRDTLAAPSGKPDSFVYEGPFLAKPSWLGGMIAKVYPAWIRLFKAKIERQPKPAYTFVSPQTQYFFRHFQRADVLATHYAQLHRSIFFLAYVLAGLSLFLAFASLGVKAYGDALGVKDAALWFVGLELALLIAILGIVETEEWLAWRDKWLNYRLLAELLRQTDVVAVAGRPMPFRILDDLAADLPDRRWVAHTYCAIVRNAGITPLTATPGSLDDLRTYVAKTRLQDQIEYHLATARTNEAAGNLMRTASIGFFILTICAIGVKIMAMLNADKDYTLLLALSIIASVSPALAYIFFAIRSQAEFEMVGRRSTRMLRRLLAVQRRMAAIRPTPLALAALGEDILSSAAVMRHDAADWASIFDVKETERG